MLIFAMIRSDILFMWAYLRACGDEPRNCYVACSAGRKSAVVYMKPYLNAVKVSFTVTVLSLMVIVDSLREQYPVS